MILIKPFNIGPIRFNKTMVSWISGFLMSFLTLTSYLSLSACTSERHLYKVPLMQTKVPSQEDCNRMAKHFIAINERGDFTPIKFDGCEPYPKTGEINWQEDIIAAINKAKEEDSNSALNILLFIHGGLNDPEGELISKSTLVRFQSDIKNIECDSEVCIKNNGNRRYYPIFVIWPSGFFDTYKDSIFNYYQGEWGGLTSKLSTPLRFGVDLAEIIARSPQSYFHQGKLWFDSRFLADTFTSEVFPKQTSYDPCNIDVGFLCETGDVDAFKFYKRQTRDNYYRVLFPAKLLTTPLADPVGRRAWQSMIARTQFAFGTPCGKKQGFMPSPQDCHDGALRIFFKALNDWTDNIPITLIGHSMGSILASELVREYPDLNYDEIVYMGAAVSVRRYIDSLEPVLKRRFQEEQQISKYRDSIASATKNIKQGIDSVNNSTAAVRPSSKSLAVRQQISDAAKQIDYVIDKLTKRKKIEFYNLSLHPFAEATETFETDLIPSGSLLEWIDLNFTDPADLTDRTLGKWSNVAAVKTVFDQELLKNGVTYFKRFDLSCRSPVKHGHFAGLAVDGDCNRIPYWQPAFWRELQGKNIH